MFPVIMQAMYNMKQSVLGMMKLMFTVLLALLLVPVVLIAWVVVMVRRSKADEELMDAIDQPFKNAPAQRQNRFRRAKADDCCDDQRLVEIDRYDEQGVSKVRCTHCGWVGLAHDYVPKDN